MHTSQKRTNGQSQVGKLMLNKFSCEKSKSYACVPNSYIL